MTPEALSALHLHLLTALETAPAETRRLFHGRGRCWPGLEQLTVDWLQGVVLVSLFKEPEPAQLEALKQLLLSLSQSPVWQASGAHTLVLQHRYTLNSDTEWLAGEAIDEWTLTEGGLRYRVDLGRKQNNGLFLDMRYGRDWVPANAQGKRVLNLFAYTCGFSVAAIEGGAQHAGQPRYVPCGIESWPRQSPPQSTRHEQGELPWARAVQVLGQGKKHGAVLIW